MLPPGYTELLRYDGAVVDRDERGLLVPCAVQPRDVEVIRDVWRYKFLTATQLLDLHWPGGTGQVGRRRLAKLFHAGLLERFRPVTRTGGSFPWTYHLGEQGHRLLREIGLLEARARYDRRTIYDYRYVLHEVHLNAWLLAWRELLGPALVEWQGEVEIEPPTELRRSEMRLDDDRSVEALREPRARLVRPDAVLDIARRTEDGQRTFLIEYDRTRRVDKNFAKFLRYDAFLCWWWRHTQLAYQGDAPWVVFVCQDDQQRATFLQVADRELTGHLWHASDGAYGHEYVGREQIVFATEVDMHRGEAVAWRVPHFPRGHPGRASDGAVRGVRLPGGRAKGERCESAQAA
ncbi:MAG: replication-relaxation family protein [Actinomycetota bacterium]|nr:replication-relaxation family protein [Actinomycetota bacterium]